MSDDNLNAEEFAAYMSKYNEYLKEQGLEPENELTFLDKPEPPNDEMIVQLFVTDDDVVNGADIQEVDFDELGDADYIRTIEGSEWAVSKHSWNTKNGRVISFEIIQMKYSGKDIIDIEHEVVEDENPYYSDKLNDMLESEEFIRAAKIRDWGKEFISISKQVMPMANKALEEGEIDDFMKRLDILITMRNSLKNY